MLLKMVQEFGAWLAGIEQECEIRASADLDTSGVKPKGVVDMLQYLC